MKAAIAISGIVLISTLFAVGQKVPAPALPPQQVTFRTLGAEDLISLCKKVEVDAKSWESMACLSYISGFTDGYGMALARFNHEMQSVFCLASAVTPQQMAKVIVKYGADHPNQLWLGAALFTAASLKDAFPCQE
jgi:hypothetical protein